MTSNNILEEPYLNMLENYKLAKKSMPEGHKSSHWDVFPDDYEKAIESTNAWKTFLRNPLSLGFNDALIDFDNSRWSENIEDNHIDAWTLKKQHNYKDLIDEIVTDKEKAQFLIEHVDMLFSICGRQFVLNYLQSHIGSPSKASFSIDIQHEQGKQIVFDCNIHDLGIMYYFWQISRAMDYLFDFDETTIVEIGAGYGGLISKLKHRNPKSRCIIFDLPELSAVQTYYLYNEFPDAKILLYKDLLEKGVDVFYSDFDFLILPGWVFDQLPADYIDMVINMRSMMEMPSAIIDYYFSNIHRVIKNKGLFACFNRYIKNSSGEDIILKNYPFDEFWSIVISQTSLWQNHIHDLILRRQAEKSDFPVAKRLESLLPFLT